MFKIYFAQKFSNRNIRPAVTSKYLKNPSRKTNCLALSWTTLIKTRKRLGYVGTCVKATFSYGSECVSQNMLQALYEVCPYLSALYCMLSFGNYPASRFYMPTFRNTLSVPSS